MKARWVIFLLAVTVAPTLPVFEAAARSEFTVGISINDIGDFYQPLGSYGYWVDVAPYGRCWYPAYIGSDWRPYCDGHWEWTECGWYWVSNEPWGWACYHYGRWVRDSYYGWVWVPRTEWGPSWVSWREGDGYVGWAPLPPECDFGPQGVLAVNVVIAPRAFVFVERRRFCEPIRPSTVIVNQTVIYQTIINKTVNVTNIKRVHNTVIVNGPDARAIERVSGQKVRTGSAVDLWRTRSERAVKRAHLEQTPAPPVSSSMQSIQENARPEDRSHEIARPHERRAAVIQQPQAVATMPAPAQSEPSPTNPRRVIVHERDNQTQWPAPVVERPSPRERQVQQQPNVEPRVRNRGNFIDGRAIEGYRQLPPPKAVASEGREPHPVAAGQSQQPSGPARRAERHDEQGEDDKHRGRGRDRSE